MLTLRCHAPTIVQLSRLKHNDDAYYKEPIVVGWFSIDF